MSHKKRRRREGGCPSCAWCVAVRRTADAWSALEHEIHLRSSVEGRLETPCVDNRMSCREDAVWWWCRSSPLDDPESGERLTSVCESSKTSSVVVEDVVAGIGKQKELVKDVMGEDGTRDVGSEKVQRKTCRRP